MFGASTAGPGDGVPPGPDYRALVADIGDTATVTSVDGTYRYVSAACQQRFGWRADQIEGHPESEFIHPDDVPSLQLVRSEAALGEVATITFRFRFADNVYRWIEATSTEVRAGGESVVVSTCRDIGARQQSVLDLRRRASIDPLTGVANRTVLMDRLRQGLRRLDRRHGLLAVLYLDLDRFKMLNDSLGHRIGDVVLSNLAERVTRHLRPDDTLARVGGDEFVVVAEGLANERSAMALANRLIQVVDEPFEVDGEKFTCTMSVGVACSGDAHGSAEDVLREADLALYRAKDRGRNRAELFDEDLRTRTVARLVTERTLRRAIGEERIIVDYQPIVDLGDGRTVGAEALVRLHGLGSELLAPASFLEVAMETGLQMAVDKLVLSGAVAQAQAWQTRLGATGFGEIGINLCSRYLADAGFISYVVDQLDTHRVPYHLLQIEVTERVLMEAPDSAISALRALRELGVRVGLDDFGTGYSSMSYLRLAPLDFVKIDQSLVSEVDRDPAGLAVVRAVIDLAHGLDLIVVAEGVETVSQLRALRSLHCDRAQGFLFAPPADADALEAFVRAGPRSGVMAAEDLTQA